MSVVCWENVWYEVESIQRELIAWEPFFICLRVCCPTPQQKSTRSLKVVQQLMVVPPKEPFFIRVRVCS